MTKHNIFMGIKNKTARAMVACAVLFFVLAGLQDACAAETKGAAGWVVELKGKPVIVRSGKTLKPALKAEIFVNDEVRTEKASTLSFQLADDTVITVGENSTVKITEWFLNRKEKKNFTRIKLASGRVRGVLNDLFGGNSELRVESPNSVAGVKGSEISVWTENGETAAAVHEGHGYMQLLDEEFPEVKTLTEGTMLKTKGKEALKDPFKITEDVVKELDKLKAIRKDDLIEKLKIERLKEIEKEYEELNESTGGALDKLKEKGKGKFKLPF